jgi:hypothetical protein
VRHIDQLWRARNRELSEKSALDDTEIADIIAFPGTLTYGYRLITNSRPYSRAINDCRSLRHHT